MKTFLTIASISLLAVACSKDCIQPGENPKEVVLVVDDGSLDMSVQTKTTEISSVPSSIFVARTTGTFKSETAKNASAAKIVSSGKINTGWYQTTTATKYNYYLSNSAITFAAGGSTVAAANTTDVIAGSTTAATTSTAPSVTLEHVFARTATMSATAPDGYTASAVTWKIVSKTGGTGGTAGTYNIATKAWTDVTALAERSLTSSDDLYLTPGVYNVTVSYTLAKGDWKKSFTKSGEVTLVAGKKNSITAALPDDGGATEIVLSVSLSPWGTEGLTLSLK